MQRTEKEISYLTRNTYSTLNSNSDTTKCIWFACHGMGYLSRYFLKYFEELPSKYHYVVAPQAQSKYYIQPEFKHVGASWLTKENTLMETENVMRYFDVVFENEVLNNKDKLILLGYSQGVSVVMRYMASRKINCQHLLIMSGGIPKELKASDFDFFSGQVHLTYGTEDEYLNKDRIAYETKRVEELFGSLVNIIPFNGNHRVNTELINTIGHSI